MNIPNHGSLHLFNVQTVDGEPCFLGTANHDFESREALFVYDAVNKTVTTSYPVSKRFALYAITPGNIIIDFVHSSERTKMLCYQVVAVQHDLAVAAVIGTLYFSTNIIQGGNLT